MLPQMTQDRHRSWAIFAKRSLCPLIAMLLSRSAPTRLRKRLLFQGLNFSLMHTNLSLLRLDSHIERGVGFFLQHSRSDEREFPTEFHCIQEQIATDDRADDYYGLSHRT